MKKLLTSVLTLALVLCCFTFVGCTEDKEKPATIEQTLAVCDQFIADMKAVETKISAQNYEYPTIDALRASKAVDDTDKSSIGIKYSNYESFNTETVFNEDLGDPVTAIDQMLDACDNGAVSTLEMIVGVYTSQKLLLNTIYSIEDVDGDISYIRLTNNKTQICLSYKSVYIDGEFKVDVVINLNSDSTWKSYEMKLCEEDKDIEYVYVEKSTDESRVFNQVIYGYIDGTDIGLSDFDESRQKMLFVHFHNNPTNEIQTKAVQYLGSLNIEDIVNDIDIVNAVEIEVNLGE